MNWWTWYLILIGFGFGCALVAYTSGWNKGFQEGAGIWKKCLNDVRDIYRGGS